MSEPASVIPKSEAGDADDVSTALETASLLWAKGDAPESIRWIRRAAEAAGEAGNDMRALALARAAADLTSAEPARQASKPPPLPVDPGVVTSAPAIGGVGPAVAPTSGASSVGSFSVAARSISNRPAAAAVPRASIATATHEPAPAARKSAPLNAPPPPSARAQPREAEQPVQRPSASGMPAVNASVNPLVSKALAAGEQEEAAPKSARLSVPPSAHPSVTAAARKVSTSTAPAAPRGRQARRVAVRPSSDEKGLLLVRVLEEGQSVPSDAHEALLVGLESGATITSRKG
jgi:hypothetical protein